MNGSLLRDHLPKEVEKALVDADLSGPIWREYDKVQRKKVEYKMPEMHDEHLFAALVQSRDSINYYNKRQQEYQKEVRFCRNTIELFKKKERQLLAEIASREHLRPILEREGEPILDKAVKVAS